MIDQDLRRALQRQAAPPDFLANVMARVAEETTPGRVVTISWWRRRSAVFALAAGVAFSAVIPAALVERRKHEQAVEAHRQLVEALQITRSKLVAAKLRIQRKHS